MKIKIPKLYSENFFLFFICLYWGQEITFSYMRAIILRIPIIRYVGDYIFPIMMIIFLLLSIPYMSKVVKWKDILFIVTVTFVYCLHLLLFEKNCEILLSITLPFFSTILPLYFIGLRLDINKHLPSIYVMSIINIWTFVIYNLISAESTAATQASYESFMHRAYVLLPQILIVIGKMIDKRDLLNISTSVMGFVFLLMCGNRGSVLLFFVYIVVYMFFIMERKQRAIYYIAIISCFVSVLVFFEQIMDGMLDLFLKLGMSTRVIDRLVEGNFFQSDGRNNITNKLWIAIWEKPIIGYGLASDRVIAGQYAHNYILELWTAFGVIVGTIFVLFTIYVIVSAWNKENKKSAKMFLLMAICTGFLKLFISSSFLQEEIFFLLLGFCVARMRLVKRKYI